jgi:hypothetical protein
MAQKTFVAGNVLTASDCNTYLSHEGGAWTSHTPTLAQGASTNIAKTVVWSTYAREGRKITWNFRVDATAAGTAGSQITLTAPVAIQSGCAGTGYYFDASGPAVYVGTWIAASSTTVVLVATSISGLGVSPAITVASGDSALGCIVYESTS